MALLSAKRIRDAIRKVQRVGRIEEPLTLDGCQLVLQNLSASEHEAADQDCAEFEQVQYANALQRAHVSRSIIEVNGESFRDVDFIEDEVPVGTYVVEASVPNKAAADIAVAKLKESKINAVATVVGDATRTVKIEKHRWLADNLLRDWGREVLFVAWRFHADLLGKAEAKAREGVTFRTAEEQPEDRFRRLLNELRETGNELPNEMIARLMQESGLIASEPTEDMGSATAGLDRMATQEQAQPVPEPVSAPPPQAPPPVQADPVQQVPDAIPDAVRAAMASRERMNTAASSPAVPAPGPQVLSANARVPVPDHIRRAAEEAGVSRRSRHIAELEGDLSLPATVAPVQAVDPAGVRSILEQPPVGGISTRYRPPSR